MILGDYLKPAPEAEAYLYGSLRLEPGTIHRLLITSCVYLHIIFIQISIWLRTAPCVNLYTWICICLFWILFLS